MNKVTQRKRKGRWITVSASVIAVASLFGHELTQAAAQEINDASLEDEAKDYQSLVADTAENTSQAPEMADNTQADTASAAEESDTVAEWVTPEPDTAETVGEESTTEITGTEETEAPSPEMPEASATDASVPESLEAEPAESANEEVAATDEPATTENEAEIQNESFTPTAESATAETAAATTQATSTNEEPVESVVTPAENTQAKSSEEVNTSAVSEASAEPATTAATEPVSDFTAAPEEDTAFTSDTTATEVTPEVTAESTGESVTEETPIEPVTNAEASAESTDEAIADEVAPANSEETTADESGVATPTSDAEQVDAQPEAYKASAVETQTPADSNDVEATPPREVTEDLASFPMEDTSENVAPMNETTQTTVSPATAVRPSVKPALVTPKATTTAPVLAPSAPKLVDADVAAAQSTMISADNDDKRQRQVTNNQVTNNQSTTLRRQIHSTATTAPAAIAKPTTMPTIAQPNYTINKGDTLWSIARRHNITLSQLREWNNLSGDLIFANRQLHTRNPRMTTTVASTTTTPSASATTPLSSTSTTHKIQRGDYLTAIAKRYGVTENQLRTWNNLSENAPLAIGTALVVRNPYTDTTTTTRAQDTQKTAAADTQATDTSATAASDANIESLINWFKEREGKTTYSMEHRNGPTSYDCSSAVYSALIAAGYLPKGTALGNTESLFGLEGSLLKAIDASSVQAGDIFISGHRGASAGANGHTGVALSNKEIIHSNYASNGIATTPINGWTASAGTPTHWFRLVATKK
ncbi:LysM peptidoglycan-binding domain-containing protein [Aerococcaceae bacterium zg-BR22]|uniref:peptidoglycan amidohydrolase family protein n=1 Tax=Aerococcaceae bacterium zg-1292 TaxID=2774330 RepID=UPI00406439B1|nr:LysM peptidoglycan-binding domain-containing protein [Aerococcaceae bacterium zg-BR22]